MTRYNVDFYSSKIAGAAKRTLRTPSSASSRRKSPRDFGRNRYQRLPPLPDFKQRTSDTLLHLNNPIVPLFLQEPTHRVVVQTCEL